MNNNGIDDPRAMPVEEAMKLARDYFESDRFKDMPSVSYTLWYEVTRLRAKVEFYEDQEPTLAARWTASRKRQERVL